jgi:hypothetical protein
MAIKPLNRKAEALTLKPVDDVRPYSFGDCCPGFLPGWEVGANGNADPCGWQNDLPACHPCYWSAQVPDNSTFPNWLDSCANVSQDWTNLCTVPD